MAISDNSATIQATSESLKDKSARRDPRELTTLPEILSCISALQSEESKLSSSLTELLNAREPIIASLTRLRSIIPQLDELEGEATLLSDKVCSTAKTADRVGSRVRSLDEEMGRVREAGDRVGQVMELKSSLSALQACINSQDWESAARHCSRAMSLPLDVISGPFAETAVPTTESHFPPAQTLQAAREDLLAIFRQNFEQASRSRDSTATSRFFKLFPSIGWEAEGLDSYATFVVDLVRVRAPASAKTSSPLYYITALTALFEGIAIIVDQHQPVVEKYYGPGKMNSVVKRLLEECDRVAKGLIEGWEEDRSMKRKLTDISNNPPIPIFASNGRRQTSSMADDSVVDPREIDKVLSEVAGMVGRWSLFKKFLSEVLKEESSDTQHLAETNLFISSHEDKSTAASQGNLLLKETASERLFEDLMTSYYIPLEVWYTRTIMDKAHRLSTPDLTQSPMITTTPDDVFYILKSVTSRLLAAGSVWGVERALQQLREIMDRDYIGIIKRKLEDVYRNTGPAGATARGDKAEKENRIAFITLLNDLDISNSHLERLTHDLAESPSISQHYSDADQIAVKGHIMTFSTLSTRFQSALRAGIEQLFNQLLRPKLRNLIPEVYKDISYVLDDESYATAEYQDLVRKRFIKAWESLLDGYKDTFSEGNYRVFLGLALDVLIRPWEKFIIGLKFSELGAIRFDRDLRSITTYLSSQTAFGDTREKFSRLQQISTLLNLDTEEDVDEFYNGSGISWKLSMQEARTIASIKI